MTTMPSRQVRCVFYPNANSGLGFGEAVERWFTSTTRRSSHGTIEVKGRRGHIFHLETLAAESEKHPEWPDGVREWLKERGVLADALVVVWEC